MRLHLKGRSGCHKSSLITLFIILRQGLSPILASIARDLQSLPLVGLRLQAVAMPVAYVCAGAELGPQAC